MNSHILKNYDEGLQKLRDQVIEMGTLSQAATEKAIKGLLTSDRDLCSDVIEDDEVIDQGEKRIDELGMGILLRFQPVAGDLRQILSSLSVSRNLERVGDHAVNIAKRARKIAKTAQPEEVRLIQPLFLRVQEIMNAALTCFSDLDEAGAHAVIEMAKDRTRSHKSFDKTIVQKIPQFPDLTQSYLNLLFISRSLERMVALSVNVAEDVVFAASAEDIRHT